MSESPTAPKVLILNNEIMPYRIPLFNALAQRGKFLIRLFYSTKRSDERQWSLNQAKLHYSYRILSGWVFKLPKPNYREWRSIWINPSLFFEIWCEKPAVIIAYEYSLPAFTAYLYSKILGCAYLIWSEMTPHTSRNLSKGQKFLRRLLLKHCDAVIATSKAATVYFREQGVENEHIFLAPQTLNLEEWQGYTHLRKKEASLKILYVGYLNERKGLRHLVQAFKLLHEKIPTAQLIIVGEGELRAELEEMTAKLGDAICFLGFREPDELPEIYAQAYIFVLPSLEDTFGVVAAEALASGLALVVSPHAGIASHLEDGENAFIVEPSDYEAMAEAMARLLQDSNLRQSFIENSQAFLKTLSPDYNAEVFEAAIEYVVAQRKFHG